MEWIKLNELSYAAAATISVCGVGVLSAWLLTAKYGKKMTILSWGMGTILYFLAIYGLFLVSTPPQYDFYLFAGWMLVIPGVMTFTYQEKLSTKIFVAVSGVFISNVCSFISGSITSMLIRNVNPWGEKGYTFIAPFTGIKVLVTCTVLFVIIFFLSTTVKEVFQLMDGKMNRFIPIPFVASVGFFCIVGIVQRYGLIVSEGIFFSGFFIIICGTFMLMYWLVFSNVLWSSKAMKTQAELNVASNIQKDMLPCIFPPFPEYQEFDIVASMQPAKEVGGDFYDFFLIDPGHIAVVVADVSGKGVPAALFMVISKTLIKNHALAGEVPKDIFTKVNSQLCENNEEGMFVTAWMGILEIDSGKLTYVNAGHNPPLLKRAGKPYEYLRERAGFILAGMEETKYRQAELYLEPGDTLYLYTDGVTEATNKYGKLYGEERLKVILDGAAGQSFHEMLVKVKADIDEFVGTAPQFDDITMLAIKMNER